MGLKAFIEQLDPNERSDFGGSVTIASAGVIFDVPTWIPLDEKLLVSDAVFHLVAAGCITVSAIILRRLLKTKKETNKVLKEESKKPAPLANRKKEEALV